jgi:histidyl-tRNA synthetase
VRNELPFVRLLTHCGGGNFKNQLKKADKSGAEIALIVGEDEAKDGKVAIKFLREDLPQQTLSVPEAIAYLQRFE